MGSPDLLESPANVTMLGSARYLSNIAHNKYVQLMDGTANKWGKLFVNAERSDGSHVTCWELRASIKINNMAAGDDIYLFGNESDNSLFNVNVMLDGDGIHAGVDVYNDGDSEDWLYIGRTGHSIADTACGINLYGDTYKTYVLKGFGDKCEFYIESEGSTTTRTGVLFDLADDIMGGEKPSGWNFGVAARCGTQTMIPEVQYIELRYIDQ